MNSVTKSELDELLPYLTKQEVNELNSLVSSYTPPIWEALDGPQTQALESLADICFYGGAAGGGKTDLAIGLCLTEHIKSIIFRKEATQMTGIIDRVTEILGSRDGYNGQDKIWRTAGKQIEFGSTPHLGTENKYQGRPHDLKVFDEITHFLEAQVRFLMGWSRTTQKGQRCRVLFTGNPPTDSNGDWVIKFFGPWLDDKHPNPAKPGELRWYATISGEDTAVDNGESFVLIDNDLIYDFDPDDYDPKDIITPKSRTFIPSRVTDNPYLMGTDYVSTLQALPEPLRSQMLYGDFSAGRMDGDWQVIPTKWVNDAMNRWQPKPPCGMEAMGVDPARGGKDKFVMSPRHGGWFGELIRYPGADVPDGQTGASLVIKHLKNSAIPCVDLIGWGASTYDHLSTFNVPAIAMNGAETSPRTDMTGKLKMFNNRSYWTWLLRDMLDPRYGYDLELPNDPQLKADLCALEYKLTARGIQVESKDEVKKRLGRSPDDGDAVIYANGEEVASIGDEDDENDYNRPDNTRSTTTGY